MELLRDHQTQVRSWREKQIVCLQQHVAHPERVVRYYRRLLFQESNSQPPLQ